MAKVKFKRGTKAQFNSVENKDANTLYALEDVQELWIGDTLFGTGSTGLTDEDRAAIVADVLAALPTWEGGSY